MTGSNIALPRYCGQRLRGGELGKQSEIIETEIFHGYAFSVQALCRSGGFRVMQPAAKFTALDVLIQLNCKDPYANFNPA
jgi:hypothetical protein